jgi:hypothetical protein
MRQAGKLVTFSYVCVVCSCGRDNAALRRSYADNFGVVSVTLITVHS